MKETASVYEKIFHEMNRLSKKSFQPKGSEGGIVGKGTVRVPFP